MRIFVINPNTSRSLTDRLRTALEAVKDRATELSVMNPQYGAASIESARDAALAIPPTLELVQQAEQENYGAVVLACFGDPGLVAARELVGIPVIGIGESTLHVAAMLGSRYSILTTSRKRIASKMHDVVSYGLSGFLASIRSLDLGVLEMGDRPLDTRGRILDVATRAIREDGAEVIILGCAGLVGYGEGLGYELGVPLLDPSYIGLKMGELFARLGLTHSKSGYYAYPTSS
jgi:allantoin racemase